MACILAYLVKYKYKKITKTKQKKPKNIHTYIHIYVLHICRTYCRHMALHMNRNRYAQFFTELKLLTDTSMYSTCVYETTETS